MMIEFCVVFFVFWSLSALLAAVGANATDDDDNAIPAADGAAPGKYPFPWPGDGEYEEDEEDED
jgi:hypothetical protein